MADGDPRLFRQPGGVVDKSLVLLVRKKILTRMAVDVQRPLDFVGRHDALFDGLGAEHPREKDRCDQKEVKHDG